MTNMKNIKFKELVTDNVFDFCAVLGAIGSEEVIGLFDKEQIAKLQEDNLDLKEIGVTMAAKICGVLIRNLSKARSEIYTFFAGCCVWNDETPVTAEDLKSMKLADFIKMIRDFFKAEDMNAMLDEITSALAPDQDNADESEFTEDSAGEVPTV